MIIKELSTKSNKYFQVIFIIIIIIIRIIFFYTYV